MTATLFLSLLGIAFLDSLNPSLFLAQFYLLTTPRPVPRILSYIAGVLLVNYGGNLLILAGLRTLVANLLGSWGGDTLRGLQLALGLAILAFGIWFRIDAAEGEARKPRSLQPIHTFALGMGVMLNELTTALPYFVAIERIAQAQLSVAGNLLALGAYNLVFSLPLLGFLLLVVTFHRRFASVLERVTRAVRLWMPRLLKWGSVLFGAVLALDAAAYFLS